MTSDDGGEIVVRDRNGNYQITIPILPPLPRDQDDHDDDDLDDLETAGGGGGGRGKMRGRGRRAAHDEEEEDGNDEDDDDEEEEEDEGDGVYRDEREAGRRLEIYRTRGRMVGELTPGEFFIHSFIFLHVLEYEYEYIPGQQSINQSIYGCHHIERAELTFLSFSSSSEPELIQAIQSSLRRKVASLDDDNWIFEAERGGMDDNSNNSGSRATTTTDHHVYAQTIRSTTRHAAFVL